MDSLDMQHLPALLRVTYKVLASRVLLFASLLMTFGLFCWAMQSGTWIALSTAGAFAIIVFLPILHRFARKEDSDGQDS